MKNTACSSPKESVNTRMRIATLLIIDLNWKLCKHSSVEDLIMVHSPSAMLHGNKHG